MVKVEITYTWELNEKELTDTEQHWEKVQAELTEKINYDCTDMFFCLRNISKPDLKDFKVHKIS